MLSPMIQSKTTQPKYAICMVSKATTEEAEETGLPRIISRRYKSHTSYFFSYEDVKTKLQ